MFYELRQRFARWLAYRQTLASLRRVPDRTLADAGISREDIRERARYAAARHRLAEQDLRRTSTPRSLRSLPLPRHADFLERQAAPDAGNS